ncbi:MAG: serpin family protein [Thermomicrobiales bacterium]|nr:serpin family protein [Thermomicrobiales bacterium]MCO5222282.1 serpin family protein [Thermomicrobiales bacterium]
MRSRRIPLLVLAVLLLVSGGMGVMAQEDATSELVDGNSAFAFDLYAQIQQADDGNVIVSPYSISQALAMTYAGADGETAAQMAAVLHFTLGQDGLPPAFQTLDSDLTTRGTAAADPDRGYPPRTLNIANGLWGEQTFPFSADFSAQLADYYGAGLQPTDFIGQPDAARDQINDWIAEQTEDRIEDIVPEGGITQDTRLVLANAIYFYGGWLNTFDESGTADADFHLLDGSTVSTPFMSQQAFFSYLAGDGFQALELPYAGSQFAFTVILPDEGNFDAVEDGLDAVMLESIVRQLGSRELILSMPKFEFDYATSVADTLQAMGMTHAFDPNLADFSGLLDGVSPETLYISDVLHKAFIGVDENGTEAAAATTVMMAGAAAPVDEPLEVSVDRPFIFLIRDTQSGAILFVGRVMDPSAA